jgi:hypothetical protein
MFKLEAYCGGSQPSFSNLPLSGMTCPTLLSAIKAIRDTHGHYYRDGDNGLHIYADDDPNSDDCKEVIFIAIGGSEDADGYIVREAP